MYKHKTFYEPIVIAVTKKEKYIPDFIYTFNEDKKKFTSDLLINRAFNLYYIAKNNCIQETDENLYKIYDKIKYKNLDSIRSVLNKNNNIKYIVTDEYYKGIGINLSDNTIIFTRPFGINFNMEHRKISELQFIELDKLC